MDRLGRSPTGGKNGTITRLNDQMRRLLTSSMYVDDNRDGESKWGIAGAHFSVATTYKLWYGNDDRGWWTELEEVLDGGGPNIQETSDLFFESRGDFASARFIQVRMPSIQRSGAPHGTFS